MPYESSVEDIEIRTCEIRNVQRYGLDLKRLFRGEQVEGSMLGHRNILIVDVSIVNPERVAIYVGQNGRDVRIERVRITRAFPGIYLEAGSLRTHVRDVTVLDSRVRAAIHID
ncbi:MAG: hypothetical protein GY811_10750 [Myxococcales bacterium]|nr:hypothetical protein [Myxococcales bacterium]